MNDEMLSQDEIDALLKISAEQDENEENVDIGNESKYLSSMEIDTIGEIGNISFGSSTTTLSMLLNEKVEITTPTVSIIENKNINDEFTFDPVSIQVDYTKGFSGRNVFVIKANDAAVIADIMLGGDGKQVKETLSEIELSAIQEAMNQMMGAAATSMSTVFNKKVDISPPSIIDGSIVEEVQEIFNEDVYVKVFFRLIIGDLVDSNMMQLIPLSFAKELVDELLNGPSESEETPVADKDVAVMHDSPIEELPEEMKPTTGEQPMNVKEPERQMEEKQNQYLGNAFDYENSPIEDASFSTFEPQPLSTNEQRNLDMLLDIPLQVTVELGRTKKTIKDILELSQGSIIELDKLAGEPVDILVNGKLIAEGEVVVIEENFGVRVTDVISKSDRLMKLK